MRQAITTRYFGPTNSRGSRIVATAEAGRLTVVPYDHALSIEGNHLVAAMAFARKWDWDGTWIGGATRDGYAWVEVDRSRYDADGSFIVERTEVAK